MKPILPQYDVINKVRNLEQGKESIREYYERTNNSFIVELGYRDKTKDVTLSEGELIWLAFVIEKWIKGVKSTRLFDYLANKPVKNLFDAYIIAERKMLKEERKLRQKKERKLQMEYQVALQQLQEFVDIGLVNGVSTVRTQKLYESQSILEEQQPILKEINEAVDITDTETPAKPTASESVKWTIAPKSLPKPLLDTSSVDESPPVLEQIRPEMSETSADAVDSSDTGAMDEILTSGPRKWPALTPTLPEIPVVNESPSVLEQMPCDLPEINGIVDTSDIESTDEILASGPGKWIAPARMEVFGYTSTSDEALKNPPASDTESASDNSFGWSRCCTVDMEVLNQEVFALAAMYDAFSKNPPALSPEDLEISVAMDMPSPKHLMDMDGPAIEAFDSGTAMGATSKNPSIQQTEDSETTEEASDSAHSVYELPALPAFDLSLEIDFEAYTTDVETPSFVWSRSSTIPIGSSISSVSTCTSASGVAFITADVTLDSIETAKTVDTVDTDFYGGAVFVLLC
ncbi:hypothetical protein G7Y79_00005g016830 [Physcia stellaris]|nr:hypothetical protein G7Y79_00005g016830 [Physcia stellaris]